MTILTWLLAGLSLIGVIMNIRKRKECFYIWAGTNGAWVYIDYQAGLTAQAALFAIYFCFAIWGIWEWRHRKKEAESGD